MAKRIVAEQLQKDHKYFIKALVNFYGGRPFKLDFISASQKYINFVSDDNLDPQISILVECEFNYLLKFQNYTIIEALEGVFNVPAFVKEHLKGFIAQEQHRTNIQKEIFDMDLFNN
jgi:hypothetical protein